MTVAGGQAGLVEFRWLNFDAWTDPLEHLTKVYELTGPLEQILQMAYRDTQARVASPAHPHVPTYAPTGRLFKSGRTSSKLYGKSQWYGEIQYGNATTQVVWRGGTGNYAVYERARGDVHDYFAGLQQFDDMYLDAIKSFFAYRRGRANRR